MIDRVLHKGVWIALVLCFTLPVAAQEGRHQVQAVIEGVRTPQHAHQAAVLIRQLPGVEMGRVDHNTRNLLLHLGPGSPVTQAQLDQAIAPLGLSLRCYRRSPLEGAGPFRHLDPRTCGQAPAER